MKLITILGSTGSIGTQTLDIVRDHPDKFKVVGLAAGNNINLLAEQIREFKPEIVAIRDSNKLSELKDAITSVSPQPILLAGEEAICEVASYGEAQSVVTGIVGCAGLLPTIAAIKAKKRYCLSQ